MSHDLLRAIRWLRNNPLFTTTITLILALGIGANTAVFSIVDAVLLRPLPYDAADRLVRIEATSAKRVINGIAVPDYFRLRTRDDLFTKIAAYRRDTVTITGAGEPDQVMTMPVSAELFALLGVRAQLGRTLVAADGESGAANVAVLSDKLWRRRFQADPGVVGRAVTLGDQVFTIVGVMGPEFEFPDPYILMWTPLHITPATWIQQSVARLKEGVSVTQAQSAVEIIARQLEQEEPKAKAGLKIVVSPWKESAGRQYELTLMFILVAVGLVLLIASANVGSLLLTRAVQRQKEIAIRASLGAGRWRVVRQLLAESLVLAVLGSAAGIAMAHYLLQFLVRALATLPPTTLPHMHRVALNERVLLFNTVLCLVLALICSLAPVLLASRTDLQIVLRGGQATGGSKGPTRLFSILIASEAAFAFLLLAGSGLMIRSLIRLQQADLGIKAEHVLTMRVPIGGLIQTAPPGKYTTKPRQMAFYHDILERLQTVPGVSAVAVVNNLPLSEANSTVSMSFPEGVGLVSTRTISSQYFSVMGIPLRSGRAFTESDQTGAPRVVIINEYLARQLFRDRDPVGQPLGPQENPNVPSPTIVGVVRNTPQRFYEQPPKGELYFPYRQFIFGVFLSTIVARTTGDPLALADAFRKEIWAVDANQPILKVETMSDVIANSIWRPRFSAWVFTVLGGLALLLTSAGVYAVVAYTTALRAKEVGIRVALGATPRRVVAIVMRDAMAPLAIGLAASAVAAVLLSRLLASLLYEISAWDPVTYVGAGVLLLAIGAIASARPAWRAAIGDPVKALRTE